MYLSRNEHDKGNIFSPEGRIFQVEYAIEAIKLGSTVVGIQTKDGIVLSCEKRFSSPLLVSSSEKIMEVDDHVVIAMSGLIADARTLVEHARVEAQNFRFNYQAPISLHQLTQNICDLSLRFGHDEEDIMSRPFGVALLIAGIDKINGPVLYHTDPSGTFSMCKGKAIGAGSEGAQMTLNEKFREDLTLQEGVSLSVSLLKQVMEEASSGSNVQVVTIDKESIIKKYSEEEVAEILKTLE